MIYNISGIYKFIFHYYYINNKTMPQKLIEKLKAFIDDNKDDDSASMKLLKLIYNETICLKN